MSSFCVGKGNPVLQMPCTRSTLQKKQLPQTTRIVDDHGYPRITVHAIICLYQSSRFSGFSQN